MSGTELQKKAESLEALAEDHQKSGLAEQLDAMPMQERIAVAKLMQEINQQRLEQNPTLPHLELRIDEQIGENVSGVVINIREEKTDTEKLVERVFPDPFDGSDLKTLYESKEKVQPESNEHYTPA